jgi:ABC-type uncharacterized transport system auxiliary subunit
VKRCLMSESMRRREARIRAGAVFILGWLLVTGCAGGGATPPDVTRYVLESPRSLEEMKEEVPCSRGTITVRRFSSAEACNGTAMLYSRGSGEQGAYRYHRWWNTPAEMVTDFLMKELSRSGLFTAVFTAYTSERSRYQLEGRVTDCIEIIDADGRRVVLGFTVALLDVKGDRLRGRLVFQKNYRAEKACRPETPAGFARVAGDIMGELSKKLISDITDAIEQDRE